MSRDYCRHCGDILDYDLAAGNARPGDTYCDECCVRLREDDEAEQARQQQMDEHEAAEAAGARA